MYGVKILLSVPPPFWTGPKNNIFKVISTTFSVLMTICLTLSWSLTHVFSIFIWISISWFFNCSSTTFRSFLSLLWNFLSLLSLIHSYYSFRLDLSWFSVYHTKYFLHFNFLLVSQWPSFKCIIILTLSLNHCIIRNRLHIQFFLYYVRFLSILILLFNLNFYLLNFQLFRYFLYILYFYCHIGLHSVNQSWV